MNKKHCSVNAVAIIRGSCQYPGLYGKVNFHQKKNRVLVSTEIKGLPETASGFFGFHIHEGSACTSSGFSNTKSHFNPTDTLHPCHSGDLPPLLLCNGGACITVATDRFSVRDIIGRTVVIHGMPDDFTSQPSGNAGAKIACGVICEVQG